MSNDSSSEAALGPARRGREDEVRTGLAGSRSNESKLIIEQLVASAQRGDSDAFAKLYDSFIHPIYRYVYFRVGKDDAEDLTELIFLKTWEHIRRYRQGDHHFSAWIFRIAHNVVVDHYRNHRAEDELAETLPDRRKENDTRTRTHRRFEVEALSTALAKLKGDYRQILVLKYINDLSNEEIAQVMDRSRSALRILQFRALKNLRQILENMGISEFEE